MIQNFITTAFRSLLKNKGFTAINILGLSVALATCLLIVFYVVDETNYDTYNLHAGKIYRITEYARLNGHEGIYAGCEKPLLEQIATFPEIEKTARFIPATTLFISPRKFFVRKDNSNIQETKVVYAESPIFDMFTLPAVSGVPSLNDPNTAVLTESAALKYFGATDVAGQTLTINDSNQYKITAVIKDVPSQSHFNFDFFLSYSSTPESKFNGWGYSGVHNYLMIKPGSDLRKIEKEMHELVSKHYPESMHTGGNYFRYELTPLLDLHLRSTAEYELSEHGSIQYVQIFSIIAAIILLIACVNFMNLSTARSSNRAKEVGVRKVLGSARSFLMFQFIAESLLLTLVSAASAVVLAWLLLPLFNQIAVKQLSFTIASMLWLLPSLVCIVLIVGFLAGSYPAFVLSAFKPVDVLKGKLSTGFKRSALRSSLVVLQFSVSTFLIIGTLVIYQQLRFIRNKNVGFNREQMLVIRNGGLLGNQAKIFRQNVKELTGVVDATMSIYLPTGTDRNITGLFPQLPIDIKQDVLSQFWPVDESYIKTIGLELIAGRNFSEQIASDSTGMIVNEAFVKEFGFTDPIGHLIYRNSFGVEQFHIIGVVKDFNYSSLREKIKPLALVFGEDRGSITARLHSSDLTQVLSKIENRWKELSDGQQFTYSFMDADFDATYRAEERVGTLFISFSTLAILIACLGLFGLAAYAAQQRNKEIGIRKVLGASVSGIVGMLSLDFIKLVAISIVIATPLAWIAMNRWLEKFAYRDSIHWWILASAGIIAVVIAFATISVQAIKAAVGNPVESLRSE